MPESSSNVVYKNESARRGDGCLDVTIPAPSANLFFAKLSSWFLNELSLVATSSPSHSLLICFDPKVNILDHAIGKVMFRFIDRRDPSIHSRRDHIGKVMFRFIDRRDPSIHSRRDHIGKVMCRVIDRRDPRIHSNHINWSQSADRRDHIGKVMCRVIDRRDPRIHSIN
jgi:hypothetical protein